MSEGAVVPDPVPAIWDRRIGRALLWLGLIAAFSPVLVDLARHVASHPWARTAIIFPLLAWVAAFRDRRSPLPQSHLLVWVALSLALLMEIVCVSADVVRLARVGLALGAAGLLVGAGWARPVSALVLVWAIPLPSLLVDALSPGLESLMGAVVAAAVPSVEHVVIEGEPSWVSAGSRLALVATDGGLPMAFAMAGLGWFRGATIGRVPSEAFFGALRWGLLALPLQFGLLGFAGFAFGLELSEAAVRTGLDQAGWLIVVAVGAGLACVSLQADLAARRRARQERA